MNRQELVQQIAQQTGQTQTAVSEVLNSFVSSVQDAVASGDKVTLVGLALSRPLSAPRVSAATLRPERR